MNADEMRDDTLLRALADLPLEDASAARIGRVRARCRAELERARRPGAAAASLVATLWRRLLEPALVSALGAVCLLEVARRAAQLLGL